MIVHRSIPICDLYVYTHTHTHTHTRTRTNTRIHLYVQNKIREIGSTLDANTSLLELNLAGNELVGRMHVDNNDTIQSQKSVRY